ncbi:MAG: NifU family protein [Bacilli bacterium]|jgi:Fe-S cluster biogenesis protein NfuA|nr:NifU family protein [Bacilli bacterium]
MNKINPELKIKELLDDLRPFLNGDGGDIEFIKYEDKFVYIKLTGACANCGFQDETISFGIEAYLKDQVPEIEGVINVDI